MRIEKHVIKDCSDDSSCFVTGTVSRVRLKDIERAFLTSGIEGIHQEETLNSCGDYLVHGHVKGVRFVSASTGFSGGYLVEVLGEYFFCKTLSDVASYIAFTEFDDLFVWNTVFSGLPFGCVPPNAGVHYFDSGDFFQFSESGIQKNNFVSDMYATQSANGSRRNPIESLVRSVDEHFQIAPDAAIMLSGGIDSTLIGVAAMECGLRPRFINLKRSATQDNNPKKADAVAELFGWELEKVGSDNFYDERFQGELAKKMEINLINPMNPHWDVDVGNSLVLSGQNADAIIGLDMSKLSAAFENGVGVREVKSLLKSLVKNSLFCDFPFIDLVTKVASKVVPKIEPSVFYTLLFLLTDRKSLKRLGLDENFVVSSILNRMSHQQTKSNLASKRMLLEQFNHFSYRCFALRNLSSLTNTYGSKTMLPYQSSSFLAFYANQSRSIKEMINPKWREVSAVNRAMKRSYYRFIKNIEHIEPNENYGIKTFRAEGLASEVLSSSFITELIDKFDIRSTAIAEDLERAQRNLITKSESKSLSRSDLARAFSFVNLKYLGSNIPVSYSKDYYSFKI